MSLSLPLFLFFCVFIFVLILSKIYNDNRMFEEYQIIEKEKKIFFSLVYGKKPNIRLLPLYEIEFLQVCLL